MSLRIDFGGGVRLDEREALRWYLRASIGVMLMP